MAAASNAVLSDSSLTAAQRIVIAAMLAKNAQDPTNSLAVSQIADLIEADAQALAEAGWSEVERKKFVDRVRSAVKGLEAKYLVAQLQDGTWIVEGAVVKPVGEALAETVEEIASVERQPVDDSVTRAPRSATVVGTGTWRDGLSGNKIAEYESWGRDTAAKLIGDSAFSQVTRGKSVDQLADELCTRWVLGGKGYNERKLFHELRDLTAGEPVD
jgi:hypothetical protein